AAEGFRHRVIDFEPRFCRPLGAQVPRRLLIDIGGDDLEWRVMPLPLDGIAAEEPLGHVPGVGAVVPEGGHNSEPFLGAFGRVGGGSEGSNRESGGGSSAGAEKITAVDHGGA